MRYAQNQEARLIAIAAITQAMSQFGVPSPLREKVAEGRMRVGLQKRGCVRIASATLTLRYAATSPKLGRGYFLASAQRARRLAINHEQVVAMDHLIVVQ